MNMNDYFESCNLIKKSESDDSFRTYKPVERSELNDLGISEKSLRIVDTIQEIKKDPPNIVVAECVKSVRFIQNRSKIQTMTKKVQYCMGLGIYTQLRFDSESNVRILRPGKYKFKNVYKPYNGQNLNNKTLLTWRTGGTGDLLFLNPVLRYLKELYPTCKIKLACGPQYQPMTENFDCIDEILDLPFRSDILFESNYHGIFEGIIERTKEAESVNAYILFSKAMGLDIPMEKLIPHQKPKPERIEECKKILKDWNILDKPFILMQIRASSPIRTPRPEFFIPIIDKLIDFGYKIIITDSPHQKEKIDKFISGLKNKDCVFNFCGLSKTLDYTIAMTSLSTMCISVDSALIHIGASLGKKVLGIYGAFSGKIRMSTYSDCDWIEPQNYGCCPCFQHGHLPCKYSRDGYPTCYDKIDVNECYSKIKKLLKIEDLEN